MLKQTFTVVAACFAGLSLTAQASTPGFTINGHISGVEDGAKVYVVDIDEKKILDSTLIHSGAFTLKGKVTNPTTCWLQCKGEYVTIQVENTLMSLDASLQGLNLLAKVTGGREQVLQNELTRLQYHYNTVAAGAYDTIAHKKFRDTAEEKSVFARYGEAQDAAHLIYMDFGKRHPDSWLGLDILYRNRKRIGKDTLQNVMAGFTPDIQASGKAKAIREYVYGQLIQKGKPFIDFSATTLEGKPFTLSALKGKYILLSFWDVGCGPCRMENKTISKSGDRFANRVEFVSFSIDKNLDAWAKASKDDHITWHNITDKQGPASIIKVKYDVQAIPASFLIGPDGNVQEVFNGYGADFLDKLEKLIAVH